MIKKKAESLEQMQIDLKHAIREYYLTDNKDAILIIQDLATKMAILHGFERKSITGVNEYIIHLDEYCRKMAMTYSYKPVFILGLLGNTKDIVPKSLDDMAKWFIKFYGSRRRKKLKPERDGLFCQVKPEFDQVVKYLRNNQIKSLQRDGVIDFDGQSIIFSNRISKEDRAWAREAKNACIERLEDYFAKI